MTPQRDSATAISGRSCDRGHTAPLVDELHEALGHAEFLPSVRLFGKPVLTRSMITVGKIQAMEEGDWIGLREPWERIRWARIYWQRKIGSATTARAAAESLHISENTYTAYERDPGEGKKATPLTHQRAIEFGRKFKVNWVWMLTGDETPFERTSAQSRALELMASVDEQEQERIADIVEAAVRRRA